MKIIRSVFMLCSILFIFGCFGSVPVQNIEVCPLQKGYEIETGPTKSDIPKIEENKMEEMPGKVTGPIQVVCRKRDDMS